MAYLYTLYGLVAVIVVNVMTSHGQEVKCGTSGTCYTYHDIPRTQADAENVCHWDGGGLVHITTAQQQTEIEQVLSQFGATETWIRARLEDSM